MQSTAPRKVWNEEMVAEWNADHQLGSRFVCTDFPDLVLTSLAPAFCVGTDAAVDCRIPGQPLSGGMELDTLTCVDNLKQWAPADSEQTAKAEQFRADMIRCRGIEFAQLGMMVEVDGEPGTIEGMNSSANLDVRFANRLKHGSHSHNCHPTWNVKYFDDAGTVIAHYSDSACVVRPGQPNGQ